MKQIYVWMINFSLSRMFSYIDKDKDGKLSPKEIKSIHSMIEKVRMHLFKLEKKTR